jgi:hypothetical protein
MCALQDMKSYLAYIPEQVKKEYTDKFENLIECYKKTTDETTLIDHLKVFKVLIEKIQPQVYVDFIILRQTHWGAVKPLVDAFVKNNCIVRIIPTPMIQEKQDQWGQALSKLIINNGYRVENFEKYDIEKELPDIVVDNMAVDCAKIPEFRFLRVSSLVEHTVHIEHSILTGYNEAMKRSYFRIGRSRCWQYLVPSSMFAKVFPLIMRIDGEFLAKGSTEIDFVYQKQSEKSSCNKRGYTVLWNVDALDPDKDVTGDYERVEKEISFLNSMAKKYPSIVSIVRMHPNFCNQLKCQKLKQRLDEIVNHCDNVVFDTHSLIYDTYNDVDAMVTWMSSTTLFSFAATGKPIIVIPTFITNGYDTMLDMHLLEVIPIAYSEYDLEIFFNTIGEDLKKTTRLQIIQEYVGPIDGTASLRIAEEVLLRYEKYFS